MEKINSIEQLDALSAKICEMLQVGIDKASVVIPETLQQIVAWQIWGNAIASIFLVVFIVALIRIIVQLCKKVILDIDDVDVAPHTLIYEITITISSFCVLCAIVYLSFESLPSFIKALVAPNLVIIEQLGGLVK